MRRAAQADFGRRLKAAMVLADVTAAQLAAEVEADLEIGISTIERIMQGRRSPRRWEIIRFAEALGVPPEFLVGGELGTIRDYDPRELDDFEARRHDQIIQRLDAQNEVLRALMARIDAALERRA